MFYYSVNGGTGSGLTTLIGQGLKVDYNKKLIVSNIINTSPNLNNLIVEPYNAILSFHDII